MSRENRAYWTCRIRMLYDDPRKEAARAGRIGEDVTRMLRGNCSHGISLKPLSLMLLLLLLLLSSAGNC